MRMVKKTDDTLTAANRSGNLNSNELKKAALVLRALNHPLRQRILSFIQKNKKVSVTTIYHNLKIEQSVTSQHLAILRRYNFVVAERNGQSILYSLNAGSLKKVSDYTRSMIESLGVK
jgi:DNA-binding transcriptional ArsR family regulator